jgi:hypothetical protein
MQIENIENVDMTNVNMFLELIDEYMAAVPERADCVHDAIVILAEEMLRLNEEMQALQKAFFTFLTETLRIQADKDGRDGIGSLKGGSKILNYVGDYKKGEVPLYWEDLKKVLLDNKTRYAVRNIESLLPLIFNAYGDNLTTIAPIRNRLCVTDWVIDQTVYRLYGLTKEEIAVVEASVNAPLEAANQRHMEREEKKEKAKKEKKPEPEKHVETYGYPSF